ncbi:MAG TPA: DUF3047 domain-containing protein [Burkholderiales bacterium]|nr:DUF3047 domain-containing protein [Burkholderiales bacterium]
MRKALIVIVTMLAAGLGLALAADAIHMRWQPGEDGKLAAGWRELTFPRIARHTRYSLVPENSGYVVKAEADKSASGLTHVIAANARDLPILQWRWKVQNLIDKADISRKDGDDYPARIYVTFAYDPKRASIGQRIKYEAARLVYGEYPPHAGLNYVWDGRAPVGTNVPNAYTDRVHMIVVDSGSERLGQWVTHERNLYEDYRASFDEEPPAISGIAIMTDTDNTGERATAYYGEIDLLPAR